jgi:thiol-disulfide isomerase/thioredoxin
MKNIIPFLIIGILLSACSDHSRTLYKDIESNKTYSQNAFEEIEKIVSYEIVDQTQLNDSTQIIFMITDSKKEMNSTVLVKLNLLSLLGKKFDLIDLSTVENVDSKKATVINFWFTTCYPCVTEMPYLETMKDKYSKNVNFIGITFNNKAEIKRFLNEHNFSFEHITVDKSEISKFGVQSYPTTMFLDKNGITQNFTNGLNQKLGNNGKYVIDDSDTHIEDEIRKFL